MHRASQEALLEGAALNEDEIALLERLIDDLSSASVIPWRLIATYMPGRSEKQLQHAWRQQPEIRRAIRERYKGMGNMLICKSLDDDGTCGTLGCKLPNKHAGLCQVSVDGRRQRKEKPIYEAQS